MVESNDRAKWYAMNAIAPQPKTRTGSGVRRGSQRIRSYGELQEQLHRDLLAQHPEWIDSEGNSPKCDEYDRRFAELISIFQSESQRP
jgi:hypothetical protein